MSDLAIIVCRDARDKARVDRQISRAHCPFATKLRAVDGTRLADIRGIAPRIIIINPGVDLRADVEGEGPLGALLKKRQVTWGSRASFIEL